MDELEQHVANAKNKAARWASVPAVPQAAESADTRAECFAKWAKIYKLFGANGESAQDEVFAAVNYYFLRNGASPAGKYRKPIRTAGGAEVSAGEVVKILGQQDGEIRQFLRGRLDDSYMFLRNNVTVAEDEELAARAANAGVARVYSWLLADWLGQDCPYFVGDEARVYLSLRASKLAATNVKRDARGGTPEDRVMAQVPEVVAQRHASGHTAYNTELF